MIIRVAVLGLAGMVVAGTVAAATGAGLLALACAARRRAKEQAAWPDDPAPPAKEET
jgi:hypothetical protein